MDGYLHLIALEIKMKLMENINLAHVLGFFKEINMPDGKILQVYYGLMEKVF